MARLTAAQIAELLRETGQRLAFERGNPYRAKAYARAADNLQLSPLPIATLIAENRLTEIPGIGDALAAVITGIYETGASSKLETLRKETPAAVVELMQVPGLRPERLRKLHDDLGISSIAALEKAARSDLLKNTKGFGSAFQTKALEGLALMRGPKGLHIHRASAALEAAARELARTHPDIVKVIPSGDYRRGCELIRDLSLVALVRAGRTQPAALAASKDLAVRVTDEAHCGAMLLAATGSDKHIAAVRAVAARRGYTLDETGLRKKNKVVAARTEAEIYEALGLPFIAPELRESGDEVRLALRGELAEIVTDADIRGVLHAHTDQSDGTATLEQMVRAAMERGYAYLGLTDHSQTAAYAGGLKVAEVKAQQRKIETLNRRLGDRFHVFKGIESDILADGSLDYPEDILRGFELIIASVHSKFRMPKREQTQRILAAIANPHTTILGHVTGRQLLRRPGYEVDMDAILQACAAHGVAVEINSHPWRLDLDWRWCKRALELGCIFSVNPDAHSTKEIDNVRWGVLMARKGAVPRERVLNALDCKAFAAHLAQRRARSGSTKKYARARRGPPAGERRP